MDKPIKNILIKAGVWNMRSSLANFYVFTRVFQKKTLFFYVGIFRENMHTLWRYFQILILYVSQYIFCKFQHKFLEKTLAEVLFWHLHRVLFFTLNKNWKFSIENFFIKCNQIGRFLRIWSYLLKKPLMEIFIFCAVSKQPIRNFL